MGFYCLINTLAEISPLALRAAAGARDLALRGDHGAGQVGTLDPVVKLDPQR